MIKIFKKLGLIGLLCFSSQVQAEENMRPITEAFAQEKSEHMIIYVFQRCSALMLEMALRTGRGEKREGSDELIEFMSSAFEAFAIASAEAITKRKGRQQSEASESLDETLEVINKLQERYFQQMEDHYLSTGNSVDEETQQDIGFCANIINGG
jgi:hypothetical protein